MGKEPKPFMFTLTPEEAEQITEAKGHGGHQQLHRRLTNQLKDGNLTVRLKDKHLGAVIRYMTQYKSGGFQRRLRRAFQRSLRKQLKLDT